MPVSRVTVAVILENLHGRDRQVGAPSTVSRRADKTSTNRDEEFQRRVRLTVRPLLASADNTELASLQLRIEHRKVN